MVHYYCKPSASFDIVRHKFCVGKIRFGRPIWCYNALLLIGKHVFKQENPCYKAPISLSDDIMPFKLVSEAVSDTESEMMPIIE